MPLYGEHQTIEGIVELHSGKIPLLFGRQYQGRIIVNQVRQLTSSNEVAALLEDLGFASVRIYMDAGDLPGDWPQSKRTGPSGVAQFTAFFDALWEQSAEDEMTKPPWLLDVWYLSDAHAHVPSVPVAPGAPAPKVVSLGRHGKARQLVLAAWVRVHGPESVISLAAAQVIQAIGMHETGYGSAWTGNGVGSNNVGALQAGRVPADGVAPPGTFVGGDKSALGKPYKILFRAYPTLLDGWVDMIKLLTVRMTKVAAVIHSPNIRDVAQAMHDSRYYEGDATGGKNPVDGYAAALKRHVLAITKELGEPLAADAPATNANPLRGVLALLVLAGGIYYWYRQSGGG